MAGGLGEGEGDGEGEGGREGEGGGGGMEASDSVVLHGSITVPSKEWWIVARDCLNQRMSK